MNPNASLKSLNTNFFAMASRPWASLQPLSFARAALRASPLSLFGGIGDLVIGVLGLGSQCRACSGAVEAASSMRMGEPAYCTICGCDKGERRKAPIRGSQIGEP